jgi:hypothetical protein
MKILNKREALNSFNFEEVHNLFVKLGYTWWTGVPTVEQLRQCVDELIHCAEDSPIPNIYSSGRLTVASYVDSQKSDCCSIVIMFTPEDSM